MEEHTENKRKRVDDDSDNSPESKRYLANSDDSSADSFESDLLRVDSEDSHLNSPEAQRIQDDLFKILNDSEAVAGADRDSGIQGLESVIRSFEEEILVPAPAPAPGLPDLASDSGESQPELGYLLEASDDELGLPPTVSAGEEARIEPAEFETGSFDAIGLDGLSFENEIPNYDSFDFEIGVDSGCDANDSSCEFVALGGLFDHSDNSEFSWRPESLPAL